MSELKWNWVYFPYLDAPNKQEESALKAGYIKVVLKDEADKVIADLEMKLARAQLVLRLNKPEALYSNLEIMSRLTHEKYVIERRERHHKYKRCLAMAWWCNTKGDWYYSLGEPFIDCVDFYIKWRDKWLKIADKFKEAE